MKDDWKDFDLLASFKRKPDGTSSVSFQTPEGNEDAKDIAHRLVGVVDALLCPQPMVALERVLSEIKASIDEPDTSGLDGVNGFFSLRFKKGRAKITISSAETSPDCKNYQVMMGAIGVVAMNYVLSMLYDGDVMENPTKSHTAGLTACLVITGMVREIADASHQIGYDDVPAMVLLSVLAKTCESLKDKGIEYDDFGEITNYLIAKTVNESFDGNALNLVGWLDNQDSQGHQDISKKARGLGNSLEEMFKINPSNN